MKRVSRTSGNDAVPRTAEATGRTESPRISREVAEGLVTAWAEGDYDRWYELASEHAELLLERLDAWIHDYCRICHGEGYVGDGYPCPACDGTGRQKRL